MKITLTKSDVAKIIADRFSLDVNIFGGKNEVEFLEDEVSWEGSEEKEDEDSDNG